MSKILPKAWYRKIVDQLAIKYKKDPRVIEYIAHYPFSFLKQVIRDEDNIRPVRFRHLGIFFLKHPELKNILYDRRLGNLIEGITKLVTLGLFESEEVGLSILNSMSKAEINKFYKDHIIEMKQL